MFTGIIEAPGKITGIESNGTNKTFFVQSPLSAGLKVDQSLSHSGVCLTVEDIQGDIHRVTAVDETLSKTSMGSWETGDIINLERCLAMNGRLDGHIVQGHVDTTGNIIAVDTLEGSWEYTCSFPEAFASLLIEKGSICLNGISLTAFEATRSTFRVAIIPYTYHHTNMQQLVAGSPVNLEFDMIGKYVNRLISLRG